MLISKLQVDEMFWGVEVVEISIIFHTNLKCKVFQPVEFLLPREPWKFHVQRGEKEAFAGRWKSEIKSEIYERDFEVKFKFRLRVALKLNDVHENWNKSVKNESFNQWKFN